VKLAVPADYVPDCVIYKLIVSVIAKHACVKQFSPAVLAGRAHICMYSFSFSLSLFLSLSLSQCMHSPDKFLRKLIARLSRLEKFRRENSQSSYFLRQLRFVTRNTRWHLNPPMAESQSKLQPR